MAKCEICKTRQAPPGYGACELCGLDEFYECRGKIKPKREDDMEKKACISLNENRTIETDHSSTVQVPSREINRLAKTAEAGAKMPGIAKIAPELQVVLMITCLERLQRDLKKLAQTHEK